MLNCMHSCIREIYKPYSNNFSCCFIDRTLGHGFNTETHPIDSEFPFSGCAACVDVGFMNLALL